MIKKILTITLLNIEGLKKNTIRRIINEIYYFFIDLNYEEDIFLSNLKIALQKIREEYLLIDLYMISDLEIELAYHKSVNIINLCQTNNIEILTILDDSFPNKLKNIKDSPLVIYYKGDINCIKERSVAVIGSRKPTSNGENIAYQFSALLADMGFCIVSGLANGCDTFAHVASLNHSKKTIAVMPCGLDMVYPRNNTILFENIISSGGCTISEYPPGSSISKYQFIQRDRLQSALSEGIVVIETSLKSGSMHTVRYAIEQNKKIACYSGISNYKNKQCISGNIKLLEDGKIFKLDNKTSVYTFINILNEGILDL